MSAASRCRQFALRAVSRSARRGRARVAVEPARDVVRVELLAPEHAGERLAHDPLLLVRSSVATQLGIELVCLGPAPAQRRGERLAQRVVARDMRAGLAQPQPQLGAATGRHRDPVPRRCLRADLRRVDRRGAVDHVVVDPVLGPRGRGRGAVDAGRVRLVLAEEKLRRCPVGAGAGVEDVVAEVSMRSGDRRTARSRGQARPPATRLPRPLVAEPQRRQHVQGRLVRALVPDRDSHQDVGRIRLRVVDLHDPVAVLVEHARVEQLELGLELRPPSVLPEQLLVRVGRLRVVVAPGHPRAGGQRVQVPPVLLGILAVVALAVRQPEHPLLEDRVPPVPQREREAQPAEHVRDAGHAVLVPAVGAGSGVVMWEEGPRVTAGAVVLPDRAPRALGEIRPPAIPRAGRVEALLKAPGLAHPFAFDAHRPPPLNGPRSQSRGSWSLSLRGSGRRWPAIARC